MKTVGLLVMAYGTPYKPEDIERYYTHIRYGRKPSPEALQDLTERYEAIGGVSPLAKITIDQAETLRDILNERHAGEIDFKLYIGLKHIEPFVEDAVAQMANDGIKEAVSVVLAPHYSSYSVKSYNGRAHEEAAKYGIEIRSVESWYDEPKFINWWAEAIKATFANLPVPAEKACLIVSAHSLPEKILAGGDPYPDQLKETADKIAQAAGVPNYEVGWQSEGNTPDPWIGPDVQDLTAELYEKHGYEAFVYTPVGFVADHLEVLFDNDVECKVVCDRLGVHYARPNMPNAERSFIEAVADRMESVIVHHA
ncbi:ferrochelatase [Exiguobacterium sp. SL-10]|uniref:ferrochelatase n=1 Tax=unclassified Exiguobacterium TaxID=2644629 RepID=UPI00103AC54D|nr:MULTISPECIES: ferrochelatase [unclassified Exiguobacterium]TCI23621.1 ferrochelatase [Exiguobacterium sp. SL-9]TCI28782.1 ferrochelatase [Exiguobacterium sp. SL-10]